jgi:hypothetical protein
VEYAGVEYTVGLLIEFPVKAKPEPIHRFDRPTLLKACLIAAILEAVAIAPAVVSPWGHAGPESLLGWLSLLVNLPGLFVFGKLGATRVLGESDAALVLGVYLIQVLPLGYILFVGMRWRRRRANASSRHQSG